MIVTDLNYHLETKLVHKLDLMIARCTNTTSRKDAVLICEGSEGEGKTNSSIAMAYYIKSKAKMEIYMFFRLKQIIEFAKNTENKVIIWDEPALDSLSTDWFKESNKDLIRLLMTCRKKRHFFIFNFVKFYKFTEYIVVDRALGLVHMYSRRGTIPGRFLYIKNAKLEGLFRDYRKTKKREYKKYKAFGGAFPIVEKYMENMGITIEDKPNCSLQDYEALKDKAIEGIGQRKDKQNKHYIELQKLKKRIGQIVLPITNKEVLGKYLGVSDRTILNWRSIETKEGENTSI